MANVLQIRRSQATATPTSLQFGELAFSEASNTLFVGGFDTVPRAVGGVGNFASLLSPALIGTPTVPTAPTATNTLQIASTAFVQSVFAGASGGGLTATSTIDCGSF